MITKGSELGTFSAKKNTPKCFSDSVTMGWLIRLNLDSQSDFYYPTSATSFHIPRIQLEENKNGQNRDSK